MWSLFTLASESPFKEKSGPHLDPWDSESSALPECQETGWDERPGARGVLVLVLLPVPAVHAPLIEMSLIIRYY